VTEGSLDAEPAMMRTAYAIRSRSALDRRMEEPVPFVVVPPSGVVGRQAVSFEVFFEAHKGELYATLCLVTRDRHEAEELTQDAFVRVLERWDRVGAMADPRSYLFRTAMNAMRSRYRRAKVAASRTIRADHPDDAFAEIDARDAAVRALATLSPRQRAAVVLTDLLGYPSGEAAKILGVRPATLRVHVSRARAALKGTIDHE
jgi:RNA polymerase sigma-70 factor (ECF subfamily)